MTPNDVLRRIRYILDLDDSKMMATFSLAGLEVTRTPLDWVPDSSLDHLQAASVS